MNYPGFTAFVEHAPGRAVSNADMPILFEDIAPRTGIHTRNVADDQEDLLDLGEIVALKLFHRLGITGKQCGGLVLAGFGQSSSQLSVTAATLAQTLDVAGSSYGVNFACSGFTAAVELALAKFQGAEKHILVVTVEILSRFLNWADEGTAILFGDRASATSIHPEGRLKILLAWAEKMQDKKELIHLFETPNAMDSHGNRGDRKCITMKGRPLYKLAPKRMYALTLNGLQTLGLHPRDLSIICQHQANGRFAGKLRALLHQDSLDHVEVIDAIEHMGNVAASSIPCALYRIQDELADGRIIACPSVGAGPDYEVGTLSHGLVMLRSVSSRRAA